MSLRGVKIVGVGHHAPARVVTNEDLERWLDTSDEWITTRTGMKRRHWAAPGESTSDLALAAAAPRSQYAALQAADIDCFIVCTVTPDYYFPATACLVAARLGAKDKPAFDISIACSGFIYGLTVASGLIRSGRLPARHADRRRDALEDSQQGRPGSTAILFGDGAGAVILEASEEDSFLSSELGSDASRPEMLYVRSSGSRHPIDHAALDATLNLIHMQGREVFKSAVTKMIEATGKALDKGQPRQKPTSRC